MAGPASNRATHASADTMLGRHLSNGSTSSYRDLYHRDYQAQQQQLQSPPPGSIPSSTELFNHAISSVNNRSADANLPQPPSSSSMRGGGAGGSTSSAIPQYPSAEDEKAAMRRYHEAMEAVNRTHAGYAQEDDDLESMYASGSDSRAYMSPAIAAVAPRDDPPPFEGPSSSAMPASAMMEKEKLRQRYAAEEAAAAAVAATATIPAAAARADPARSYTSSPQTQPRPLSPPGYSYSTHSSPVASGSSGNNYPRYNEKEALQRFFANQDAAALANGRPSSPPQPPAPRSASGHMSPVMGGGQSQRSRSPPLPPVGGPGMQPLTAAQEKALLKAKMDAEAFQAQALQEQQRQQQQQQQQSYQQWPQPQVQQENQTPDFSSIPPPPPLMPRPPAEYIRETQEEDMDVRQSLTMDGRRNNNNANGSANGHIELQPFTPFSEGFSGPAANGAAGGSRQPRPPLPPKVPYDDEMEP
jgi:hypothetical protein